MAKYDLTLQQLLSQRSASVTSSSSSTMVPQVLSEAEVLHIGKNISAGLLHLHREGFAHRYSDTSSCCLAVGISQTIIMIANSDLKPDNIMFAYDGVENNGYSQADICQSRPVIIDLGTLGVIGLVMVR